MEILKKVNSRTICFGLKYSTPWMKPNIPVQHMLFGFQSLVTIAVIKVKRGEIIEYIFKRYFTYGTSSRSHEIMKNLVLKSLDPDNKLNN